MVDRNSHEKELIKSQRAYAKHIAQLERESQRTRSLHEDVRRKRAALVEAEEALKLAEEYKEGWLERRESRSRLSKFRSGLYDRPFPEQDSLDFSRHAKNEHERSLKEAEREFAEHSKRYKGSLRPNTYNYSDPKALWEASHSSQWLLNDHPGVYAKVHNRE